MGNLFKLILVNPTINLLLVFYYIFSNLGIPGAFGWSLVALTTAIRALFNPFYEKQMKMSKQMQDIKPELDALSKKFKNDKQRLQQEQLKLYKDRGINPAAGCVVALVQIPFFIALYQVITLFLNGHGKFNFEAINSVVFSKALIVSRIDPMFFGYNLTATPSQFRELGWYYLLIPIVTAILQYMQISLQTPKPAEPSATAKELAKKDKNGKDTKPNPEDFQAAMGKQMKIMLPLMIGYFSYTFPVGLALYWNVFSLFSIYQYQGLPWKKRKTSNK